jgi:hypothetical protein
MRHAHESTVPVRNPRSSRVIRYTVVAVYEETPMSIRVADDWQYWEEELYVKSRMSVQQVYCALGRGYFGA